MTLFFTHSWVFVGVGLQHGTVIKHEGFCTQEAAPPLAISETLGEVLPCGSSFLLGMGVLVITCFRRVQ